MLTCEEYISAASLDEAFDAMAAHAGSCRIVAGATDILPWAREGRAGDVHIPVLIDVAAIPELTVREISGNRVRIGAATPFQRFLDDQALRAALPAMPRCAIWFADDQIRESATIGGNLVNASPAADGNPALLAHDASVVLAARRNGKIERRKLTLSEFLQGPGRTAMAEDELLIEVQCEALPRHGGAFEKVGHRRSLVISTVCLAALAEVDASGRNLRDLRLAVGGVGPVPRRLEMIEAGLVGKPLDARLIVDAAHNVDVYIASRTRRDYRREVLQGFVVRSIVNALKRAGAQPSVLPDDVEALYA